MPGYTFLVWNAVANKNPFLNNGETETNRGGSRKVEVRLGIGGILRTSDESKSPLSLAVLMLLRQRQMRLVTIPFLLAFAAVLSSSQTPSAPPPAKHKTKVETKFDAHKNETELRIGPLEIWKNHA